MNIDWGKAINGGPKFQKMQPGLTAVGGLAGGIMDAVNRPDIYGRRKAGMVGAGKALELAGTGAMLGPIGAGVGAVAGFALGFLQQRKANREGDMAEYRFNLGQKQAEQTASAGAYNTMNYGTSWAKNGGPLSIPFKKTMRVGGQLQPLNSDTELAQGRKHSQGGIYLNEYGAEVEDGETIYDSPEAGPYVFSDFLRHETGETYAERDEKLARSLGKLERKFRDPLRDTAMQMMQKQREANVRKQEMHRKLYEQQLLNA